MKHYAIAALLVLSACANSRAFILTDYHEVAPGADENRFAEFAIRACPGLGKPYRIGVTISRNLNHYQWGCETKGEGNLAAVKAAAEEHQWLFVGHDDGWSLLSKGVMERDAAVTFFGAYVTRHCQDTVGKLTAISAVRVNGVHAASCSAYGEGTRVEVEAFRAAGLRVELLGDAVQ